MPDGEEIADIESTVAEVAVSLFAPGTVQGTLQKIVQLAMLAIDGCEAAGVLAVGDDGEPTTLAASSPLAVMIDQLQIDAGEGRRASQHLNIKLSEVAATLVETGHTPDTGSDEPADTN